MAKILVIDDERAMLEEIMDILSFEGFEVIGAGNGRAGVQQAQDHLPDLIISDIMMPELDGHGVLSELQANPVTAMIPVIFLTAKARRRDIREGIEVGAKDYLTKPFTVDELLGAIKARLIEQESIAGHYEQKMMDLRFQISHTLPHELRTPLVGILGFAEMLTLDSGEMPRSQIRSMADMIFNAGKRLHRLIENYLLFAQIEVAMTDTDKLNSLRQSCVTNPGEIITEIALAQSRSAERADDLAVSMTDASIQVSESNLKKIAEEFINNSFKFSEVGTPVSVTSVIMGEFFELSIEDAGRGMTQNQINEIGAFAQFERTTYEQQGSGMGLVIARRLVEMHGGSVTIKSVLEQGTKVTVIFPIVGDLL